MGIDMYKNSSEEIITVTWYNDGARSSGVSEDLDSRTTPNGSTLLPSGYNKMSEDIIGMALLQDAPGDWTQAYAWYYDGKASAGTVANRSSSRSPYRYSLPVD